MDSINRNQPENNREDLQGQAAVKKIKDMVKQTENCWLAQPSRQANQMATGQ